MSSSSANPFLVWMRFCRMAWWRFDRWLEDRAEDRDWRQGVHDRNEAFDSPDWFFEIRPGPGGLLPTPEDLAEIGPADPVTRVPRRGRGRHARDPKEGT